MVRFAWAFVALRCAAGVFAGSQRQPGLLGLRDALRDSSSRIHQHDGFMTNPNGVEDGTANKAPLTCFEVQHPVLGPHGPTLKESTLSSDSPTGPGSDSSACTVALMKHSFGNSYGSPFTARYSPPECAFDRVVLTLDVVSEGRQFDRLAILYLGDVEIWRTSTAEPKPGPGIAWTVHKDATPYLPLWREPQKLIFDLGNLVNDKYTGAFNVTLTATFFTSDVLGPNGVSADTILSISAHRGAEGKASAFTYPEAPAEAVLTLPKNVNRAILTVSATGQAGEEFWWSNVPEKNRNILGPGLGALPGLSSYREVQVRIDGQVVGLAWPFPVVFTGGIAPPLHRPVVGIQAFDLREHEIDVSPFLGLLCDGMAHNFTIDIYGVNDTTEPVELAQVPMHWVVSGKLFLWLDDATSVTAGSTPVIVSEGPVFQAMNLTMGDSALIHQSVQRSLEVRTLINTQQGPQMRSWQQGSNMIAEVSLTDQGDTQRVRAFYEHSDLSATDDESTLFTKGTYPINSHTQYREPDGNYDFSLKATLFQSMDFSLTGQHVFATGIEPFVRELTEPGDQVAIRTWRRGHAFFGSKNGGQGSSGHGNTDQSYALAATEPLYERFVSVRNESTLHDREFVLGRHDKLAPSQPHESDAWPAFENYFGLSNGRPLTQRPLAH